MMIDRFIAACRARDEQVHSDPSDPAGLCEANFLASGGARIDLDGARVLWSDAALYRASIALFAADGRLLYDMGEQDAAARPSYW